MIIFVNRRQTGFAGSYKASRPMGSASLFADLSSSYFRSSAWINPRYIKYNREMPENTPWIMHSERPNRLRKNKRDVIASLPLRPPSRLSSPSPSRSPSRSGGSGGDRLPSCTSGEGSEAPASPGKCNSCTVGAGAGHSGFRVRNTRLLRRFAPPASPGEAGAGLAMTKSDYFLTLLRQIEA
jgi:hypothetical protein